MHLSVDRCHSYLIHMALLCLRGNASVSTPVSVALPEGYLMLELLPNLPHELLLLLYISAALANTGIPSSEERLSQVTLALCFWSV